jgi:septin family protein
MTVSNTIKENTEERNFFIEKHTRQMKTSRHKKKITLNALLLGDKSVGKTSIGKRLTSELNIGVLLAETYGIDFHFLKIHNQERLINLQILDVSFKHMKSIIRNFLLKMQILYF